MSDKNNLTSGVNDFLLEKLLDGSKKHRIKAIAERYGVHLSDKNTKQQMIDAVAPAIETYFGVKLKQYTDDDLSIAIKCFTEQELPEPLADKIFASSPFADGAIFVTCKKDSYFAAVPHELAGKLMMRCVTRCFDTDTDELDICARACAAIYGGFNAETLATVATGFTKKEVTAQQAEQFLATSASSSYTYENGVAISASGVSYDILPEASETDAYIPSPNEIRSYAAFGADTSDYYYRQIVNFLYNNADISYDTVAKLMKDITVWCSGNNPFSAMIEEMEGLRLMLSPDRLNYLIGMIAELNSRTRKPCLKGHKPTETEGYHLPVPPQVVLAAEKPATVRTERKVGRNDPCPCGSGKKYKKCCGKKS